MAQIKQEPTDNTQHSSRAYNQSEIQVLPNDSEAIIVISDENEDIDFLLSQIGKDSQPYSIKYPDAAKNIHEIKKHKFVVVITNENGIRFVQTVSSSFLVDGKLFYPKNKKKVKKAISEGWEVNDKEFYEIKDFQIVSEAYSTYKEALIKEKARSLYSDTESEIEKQKNRLLKRNHPVSAILKENFDNLIPLDSEMVRKKKNTNNCYIHNSESLLSNNSVFVCNINRSNNVDSSLSKATKNTDASLKNKLNVRKTTINEPALSLFTRKEDAFFDSNQNIEETPTQLTTITPERRESSSSTICSLFPFDNTKTPDNVVEINNKFTKLFNEIEEMKNLILSVHTMCQSILRSDQFKQIPVDKNFKCPIWPLNKRKLIIKFNKDLEQQFYRDQVFIRLSKVHNLVGTDIRPSVKRVMEKLFAYKALVKFSWSGKTSIADLDKNKEQFFTMEAIINLIMDLFGVNVEHKAIEEQIKYFMRRVPQRYSLIEKKAG